MLEMFFLNARSCAPCEVFHMDVFKMEEFTDDHLSGFFRFQPFIFGSIFDFPMSRVDSFVSGGCALARGTQEILEGETVGIMCFSEKISYLDYHR